jgi:hypothetical protein
MHVKYTGSWHGMDGLASWVFGVDIYGLDWTGLDWAGLTLDWELRRFASWDLRPGTYS